MRDTSFHSFKEFVVPNIKELVVSTAVKIFLSEQLFVELLNHFLKLIRFCDLIPIISFSEH